MQRMPGGWWPWALAGAGLAVVLGALVGLGAVLGAGPFSERELSRAELVAEGDEACVRARERFAELQDEPPRSAREAARLTERLIEIASDEQDRLARLRAPEPVSESFERYLAARERAIEAMREGLEAAEAGDAEGYESAQARVARTQRDPRRRLALAVGFRQCSRPIAP